MNSHRRVGRVSLFVVAWVLGVAAGPVRAGETVPQFTGSDSYVLVGTPPALQIPSNEQFTVEGWIYFNALSGTRTIYSKNSSRGSPYTYMFGLSDATAMRAYTGAGGTPVNTWRDVTVSPSFVTGRWYHLAYSFDGTTLSYYRDGILVGTQPYSFGNYPTHTVKLGGYSSATDLNGRMCDMRVWDHARSQGQIQFCMPRRLFGNEPGLLAYWRLDEGSGTSAFDLTANACTGTLQGASWAEMDLPVVALAVAHPLTGSQRFTNTNEVDFAIFPIVESSDVYQIQPVL